MKGRDTFTMAEIKELYQLFCRRTKQIIMSRSLSEGKFVKRVFIYLIFLILQKT